MVNSIAEEIERHQPGELTAVDHLVPQLDALFRLGKGALPLEQERQRERNTRQGIDQEGQVPVDVGQVARKVVIFIKSKAFLIKRIGTLTSYINL